MKKSAWPRAQRRVLEATTVVIAGAFLAQAAVPDARAATIAVPAAPAAPVQTTQAATAPHIFAKKQVAERPAETYEQRQDRISRSTHPLLARPALPQPQSTTCVSGEFTSLAVVYDSLVTSTLGSLPPEVRQAALNQNAQVKREMERITVSTLAISEHPLTLGADNDDPAVKYRSPHSQLLVGSLLKIRDGKQNEAIALADITLSQAVETAWLYFFTTVLAPARFIVGVTPSVVDLPDLPAPVNFLNFSNLMTIGFAIIRMGLTQFYSAVSEAILDQCVARVTDDEKSRAGTPSDDVVYDIPIHPILQSIADQLALAGNETCTPIGDLSLGRIVTRTAEAAKSQTDAAGKRRIDAETKNILRQMRAVAIPHHLIPADPADFSTIETIGSYIGGIIPIVGGAPLDILIGLGHNIGEGHDMTSTVSLADLTVTKSLTASYYSYYLAVHLFSEIGHYATGKPTPSPFRIIGAFLDLPLTYGLVTYHHVVRSMCLREDDTTGTGLGAEKNKRDYDAGIRTAPRKKAEQRAARTPASPKPTRRVSDRPQGLQFPGMELFPGIG